MMNSWVMCMIVVSLGYKGVFIARNTMDFCEGEATFYRTSRFSLESSESLLLSDVISQVWYALLHTCISKVVNPKTLLAIMTTFVYWPFSSTTWIGQYQNVFILAFIGAKDDDDDGDTSVKLLPPTNRHRTFCRWDVLLVAQTTVFKHWMEKYHIAWTCLTQANLWSFNLFFDH